MINLNTVYQIVEDNTRIRIVYLDRKHDVCAFVHIENSTSMPVFVAVSVFDEAYENAKLVEISDPYFKIQSDDDLSKSDILKRDRTWQIICKYWDHRQCEIIAKATRASVFQEIAQEEKMSAIKVKRIFSRFWQRGMTKNALLSDYVNSGGKGKEKKVGKHKIGRKSVYGASEGIVITDVIKKQFEAATNKYWRNKSKKSLRQVYRLMLADFYSIEVRNNASISKIIYEHGAIPTFQQYYFWFKKTENPILDIKARDGENEFELKHRPILSTSVIEAPGPGFRFQIDSTVADIYIVSDSV